MAGSSSWSFRLISSNFSSDTKLSYWISKSHSSSILRVFFRPSLWVNFYFPFIGATLTTFWGYSLQSHLIPHFQTTTQNTKNTSPPCGGCNQSTTASEDACDNTFEQPSSPRVHSSSVVFHTIQWLAVTSKRTGEGLNHPLQDYEISPTSCCGTKILWHCQQGHEKVRKIGLRVAVAGGFLWILRLFGWMWSPNSFLPSVDASITSRRQRKMVDAVVCILPAKLLQIDLAGNFLDRFGGLLFETTAQ